MNNDTEIDVTLAALPALSLTGAGVSELLKYSRCAALTHLKNLLGRDVAATVTYSTYSSEKRCVRVTLRVSKEVAAELAAKRDVSVSYSQSHVHDAESDAFREMTAKQDSVWGQAVSLLEEYNNAWPPGQSGVKVLVEIANPEEIEHIEKASPEESQDAV